MRSKPAAPSVPPAQRREAAILVGVIGGAHGVRGEVRVKSYTGEPAAIAGYGPLQDQSGTQSFEIEALRLLRGDLLVTRIKGVRDRAAAEALAHMKLYVPRCRLPPPAEEEFLHIDLIGLRAETSAGVPLGMIVAVQNFGAGDLLEITPPHGETLLVAFTRANVPLIDLAGCRIVVDPPPEISGEEPPD